ncbi:hypothetical protein [Pseudocolwellia sp. HL-MZ7]|uniref:hypothetical protein n=1 Tax=Pseudocolwellia sp. HL-MZ7 TaxID=3400627 RepID=UPI003CE82F5A
MNKLFIFCISLFLSACSNDYAEEKQELISKAKSDATSLITEHEAELNQFSEFLIQSQQSFISIEDYQAYLYMKNNISEAEANEGRTAENEPQFQLEKLAYSLDIIYASINKWGDSNLVTFEISKVRNPEFAFSYFLIDLKHGDNGNYGMDFNLCSDLGKHCKVSKQGRWLQVYVFQNNEKLDK